MLRYQDVAQNTARLRALTSVEPDEFIALVPAFETCLLERMRAYTIDGLPRRNRRYTPDKNSPLPAIEDKLLFMLVHMKQNLTQAVQGQLFGMIQSDAHTWLQRLRPVLLRAVDQLDVVPARLATLGAAPAPPAVAGPPFFIMIVPNVSSNDQ